MTDWDEEEDDWEEYFNSHPHEEDDKVKTKHFKTVIYFNSHPHEEDDHTEHF